MKNKKRLNSLNWGLLSILFIAFLIVPKNIYAIDDEEICQEGPDNSFLAGLFESCDPKLDNHGGDTYKISLGNCATSYGSDLKFKVTYIGYGSNQSSVQVASDFTDGAGSVLTNGSTLYFTDSSAQSNNYIEYVATIKAISPLYDRNKSCYYTNMYSDGTETGYDVTMDTYYVQAREQSRNVVCPSVPTITEQEGIAYIDCNASYANGSFEQKFCYAKSQAQAAGMTWNFNGGEYSDSNPVNFYCASNINDSSKVPRDTLTGEAYYVNKDYMYGVSSKTISTTYSYRYASTAVTKTVSCDIACEEAVEVEYGPPVASKAGLCFEYKVKVTSRVSCQMSSLPAAPDCSCNVCTPAPECYHGGVVYRQGGPNEDYDTCVKACDGGKYTKKCSNKCYEKVYGTQSNSLKLNSTLSNVNATKTTYLMENGCASGINAANVSSNSCDGGYYTRSSVGSSISWVGYDIPGRWYCENVGWDRMTSYNPCVYGLYPNGFFKNTSTNCQDSCVWTGCGGNTYLNEYEGAEVGDSIPVSDCKANISRYIELVNKCQNSASCSTKTATFTISADYLKAGSNTSEPLSFPYGSSDDYITYSPGNIESSYGNGYKSTLLPNDLGTDLGIQGCYKDGVKQNYYRSTWGFPGTLINLKTGEISYNYGKVSEDSPNSICYPTSGECNGKLWYYNTDKFCVPRDQKSVNADWWNAYYRKLITEKGLSLSIDQSYVKDACLSTESGTIYDTSGVSPSVDYNIHAKTVGFGYMNWKIMVNCFFAVNNKPTYVTSYGGTASEKCDTSSGYDIRSVDLKNLFPDEGGADTLNSSVGTGREPGFNWSEYSTYERYSSKPNSNGYKVDPKNYISLIQERGDTIYSGVAYLDYQFYLSPSDIRKLRSDIVSSQNYTDFSQDGFYVDVNGIARYKSSKIRELSGIRVIPADQKLACNNMHDC